MESVAFFMRRFAVTLLLLCTAAPMALAQQTASAYRIGPEDVLEISVWKEEGMQKEVLVRPDGGLSFPLAGDIQATGMSVTELRDELTRRLQKFIANPVVTVSLRQIGGNKIYVIGKVNKPGAFSTGRYVDVMQALSMAGGLNSFAAQDEIRILRRDNTGNVKALDFDYNDVQNGRDLAQNIVLHNGDVVVVP